MIFILLLATTLYANDHRELGPHVHGAAQLSVATEKNTLDADLDIPGINLVGFEHKPQKGLEQKKFDALVAKMNTTYELFNFPPDAGCKTVSRRLESTQHPGETHMDFEYTVKCECNDISKLDKIGVNLFHDFKSLNTVKVDIVTETNQTSDTLTPKNIEFKLK